MIQRIVVAVHPVDGVRVVDLFHAPAGPVCMLLLGDLRADGVNGEEPAVENDSGPSGPPFKVGKSACFLKRITRST